MCSSLRYCFLCWLPLYDVLESDELPQDIPEQGLFAPLLDGNYKCNGCAQCNGTYKCRSFKHPQTGKSIPIKGVITCSTKAVIYLITCPCGKNYVGKTKRELKVRISEHLSTIRCKNFTYPVAAHILEAGHSISSLRLDRSEEHTSELQSL